MTPPSQSRRRFLKLSASSAGAALSLGGLSASIQKALAIPASSPTGTIKDIKRVVILMQENRSFDHYFGTLRGVRGFGDRIPRPQPDGSSVFHQRDKHGKLILPFRMEMETTSAGHAGGNLPHSWQDQHAAWNHGRYDNWIEAKKNPVTMGYFTRADIPFHFALAEAFTICDAYHCSVLGSTNPNRFHMMTGTVDPRGANGGPVTYQPNPGLWSGVPGEIPADADSYTWTTYPERLLQHNISWRVYQGTDDLKTHDGDYPSDFNILQHFFRQYQTAAAHSPLWVNGCSKYTLGNLAQDVANDTLPQVSWLMPPKINSEHPAWTPAYGASYISKVLDILTSNPVMWSSTALLITYDENDGFFDHMVPPAPPISPADGLSTVDVTQEFHTVGDYVNPADNLPYGLGARVPMFVVSPWSKGGAVCSQLFDHTSIIRFLEQVFDVKEPNISPWRRAVCGDLTSAFDFSRADPGKPDLPDTSAYQIRSDAQHKLPPPLPPDLPSLPQQEPGARRARALPYALSVDDYLIPDSGLVRLDFDNSGKAGAVLQVYSDQGRGDRKTYTLEAGKKLSDSWSAHSADQDYDLSVYGPNGFLRRFKGAIPLASSLQEPTVRAYCDAAAGDIVLRITNHGEKTVTATVVDNIYDDSVRVLVVEGGKNVEQRWRLASSHQWYDLTVSADSHIGFLRRLAGHVETGKESWYIS
ncbi:phosphocholine-specific phospholipase C [Collimonas sp.]|jgi:phospholipase C|uniref:phosphocholine-specific phospholipase C n=1 Tax=Collimonas sp. TaxID=1963772 RepID=UPI002CE821E3|nr:phospholipase C, phosphocholine-specific [Collimonas sp.]HWW07313.1 phospholipase C, phosphocholine-specific [Collimonas sp.]